MTEVGERESGVADLAGELAHLRMRQLQEVVENAELVENFQRRRMNSIAAEIPEKIRVLLEDGDVDARAREEKPKHHAGGSATTDATVHGLV